MSLPFGWEARTNAVPPVELGMSSSTSTSQSTQNAEKKAKTEELKPTPAQLPFGWGLRTNAVPPENETHTDTADLDPVTSSLPSSSSPPQPLGAARILPFDWEKRTNVQAPTALFNPSNTSDRVAEQEKQQEKVHSEKKKKKKKLLVGTRIHFANSSADREQDCLDQEKLHSFLSSAKHYADAILIAIGTTRSDTVSALETILSPLLPSLGIPVQVLEVTPWGKFTPALNAIARYANDHQFELVCFQSLEVNVSTTVVESLVSHCVGNDTLVCGAAFPNQHIFCPGLQVLSGRTTPWNTLAVWKVSKLCLLGFVMIGDGLVHVDTGELEVPAGVEEVSTITMLQKIAPLQAKAKLVMHKDMMSAWNTDFADPARKQWHEEKMKSKETRAQAQLDALQVEPGIVQHIAIQ